MSVLEQSRRLTARGRGLSLGSVLRTRPFVESAVFAGSGVLVGLLGMVSTAVLARTLGPDDFGQYAFGISFVSFAALFFEFGVFLPAARLAAATQGEERQRVLGAAFMAFLPIGLAFSATIFGLSYAVDAGFHTDAGHALRVMAPLAFAYPLLQITIELSQGVDRLHMSSITMVVAQAAFVVFILAAVGALESLSVSFALVLRAFAFVLAGAVFVIWIRPVFSQTKKWIRALIRDTRAYGFSAYIGRVLGIGTYNVDVLMLAAFTDARTVGFYILAGTIAYASGLPVAGMASALFARMKEENEIGQRWIVAAWTIGIAAVLLAWGLAHPFVEIVFSPRYLPAAALVLPLALAQMVRGVTTVYNTYLAAHAKGRELRNAAAVLTASNVVLNLALIPPFGATGAAWASFFALVANLAAHIVYYRRSLSTGRRAAPVS